MKIKISGKELLTLGFPQNNAINIALGIITSLKLKRLSKANVLSMAQSVLHQPESFLGDAKWGRLAEYLVQPKKVTAHKLLPSRVSHTVFGENEIEDDAKQQFYDALRLPIAVSGALMPDAHAGYGLPIGSVLATKNAVIPYGVGVDIGCRMSLSVFDLAEDFWRGREDSILKILNENTKFGMSETHKIKSDHAILHRDEFKQIPILKQLHSKAIQQLGTSGGGNHFVEFGIVEIAENSIKGLPEGKYFAVLSHSGSRSLGANIAKHYTKIAMKTCPLPSSIQHLAWLDLDSHDGKEYWAAMNLAGEYACACHEDIHRRLSKALGKRVLCTIENHHNFAWKEIHNGEEFIVHRKGATPAARDQLGIIPGSMTSEGYLVRGLGNEMSLNSASHGAGRKMSRAECKNSITTSEMKKILQQNAVSLIGGNVDESPMAYKDIQRVMALQSELVEIIGTFTPKFVKMNY
ncbi:MAG TPA: RtcB family protein [Saprospiraceae bacterium]|nr:RtcB family protein [Saprospiraceae bacterium]